ncbi:hypothetical protein QUF75_14220 [Desulfococcaceae bacterium HSG7]|nr:hypothetical protein [Desulfococcaceae bacterium HSG7]
MSANFESEKQFFDACETGKGWDACKAFCHSDATCDIFVANGGFV